MRRKSRTSQKKESAPRSAPSGSTVSVLLETFARKITSWVGGNWAFAVACMLVLVWIATGPAFGYSDTWQLVINTGTTVITFLMVFLIQRAQNKESRAIQLKLNEIVAALQGASNRLIGAESLTETELETLTKHYATLLERVKSSTDITESHSIDEAHRRHEEKDASFQSKARHKDDG